MTTYLDSHLRVFMGKADQAESTTMPATMAWIQEVLQDCPEVRETDDHAMVAWLCMPTAGIVSAMKMDFFITFICNFLTRYRRNSIVLIVHPNRAAQASKDSAEKRTVVSTNHFSRNWHWADMMFYPLI